MAYRVTASVSPAADTPIEQTLVRLWTDNLHMQGDPRHKYEWYYRNNPLGPATAFFLEHVDAQGATSIVGSCGVGTRRIIVAGQPLSAALFADFTVDKAHRTVMPAMVLQRALCAQATASHDFAYAFPNDAAVGIFQRIGLRSVGRVRRFVKVLHSAALLRPYLRWAPAASLAGAVVDYALAVKDILRGAGHRRYSFEWLEGPDERFDRLWEKVQPTWKNIGERNAEFLRWRFTTRPGVPSRLAALIDRKTREVHAYAAVVDKTPREARVVDFLATSNELLALLLTKLGPALAAKGYERAVTYFLGPRSVDAALEHAGFRFRNEAKFVIVGARAEGPIATPALAQEDDWYLTEADRDN